MKAHVAVGLWLLVLAATVGWLLGGATLDLATGGGMAPWLFTAPVVVWLGLGVLSGMVWGGVRLIRRG